MFVVLVCYMILKLKNRDIPFGEGFALMFGAAAELAIYLILINHFIGG